MAGNTLDTFLENVQSQDTRKRIQVHPELVAYLKDPDSSLYCEEMDRLVDALSAWINSSNYKISLSGLEVVALLIDRMGDNFKHHVPTVLPAVVDRLGDNKDQVRGSAQEVLIKIMSASSPQYVYDRMAGCFSHKLWHVREETLVLLQSTLNHYGAKTISLSKIVPIICKMLEDQSIPVREQAVNTLVEIYRHVGERVRQDIAKKDISQTRLNQIMTRMNEVRDSGTMIASASDGSAGKDEIDFAKPVGVPRTAKRTSSIKTVPARRPATGTKPPSAVPQTPKKKRAQSAGSGSGAGACDEDLFMRSFEDVPKLHLFTARELSEHISKIKETLSDPNNDWEKRVDSLKEVRSLLIAGATQYDDFLPQLRTLEQCFQTSAKDLRSQVVREACISTAYLSQVLQNKFDHFAESILPTLMLLIPNTAKVMATAGTVSIRFLIQYTHAPRLIPILTNQMTHKSSIVRKECSEFLDQLLHTWATHTLERHIAILQEAIRRGISDSDTDARAHSRKAFWGFADHFKEQADSLLNSLEPSRQKQLQGELSNSSSNNSLNSGGPSRLSRAPSAGSASASAAAAAAKAKNRSRSMSTDRKQDVYTRPAMSGTARRSIAPKATKSDQTDANGRPLMRSNSAVDLADRYGQSPRTQSIVSRTPQNNYSSLRFRSVRQLKAFKKTSRSYEKEHKDNTPAETFHDKDSANHRDLPHEHTGEINHSHQSWRTQISTADTLMVGSHVEQRADVRRTKPSSSTGHDGASSGQQDVGRLPQAVHMKSKGRVVPSSMEDTESRNNRTVPSRAVKGIPKVERPWAQKPSGTSSEFKRKVKLFETSQHPNNDGAKDGSRLPLKEPSPPVVDGKSPGPSVIDPKVGVAPLSPSSRCRSVENVSHSKPPSSRRSAGRLYRAQSTPKLPVWRPFANFQALTSDTFSKKSRDSGSLTRLSLSFDENALRQGSAPSTSRRLPTPEKRLSRSTIDLSSSELRSRIPRRRTPSFSAADTRPKKSSMSGGSNASSVLSPERSRPRARIGVSQSQPSSRSGSPSSRLSYITHTNHGPVGASGGTGAAGTGSRPIRKSGIPRSQGASRETSPSRLYGKARERKFSGSGIRQLGQAQRVVHTKPPSQVLSPGSDMESAFAEALKRLPGRKRFESYESDDAGSENSSVCSERSFGSSFGRQSELPQGIKDGAEKPPNLFPNFEQDVSDILNNLSSPSWADRKEGLVALQNILRGARVLNRLELKKITEIFTRMFHDPHGKVFSMFLETLIDFVAVYKLDLSDWLYVLLTRLLNKMGADMLGSVLGKVQRCVEAVRDSFPFDLQFVTITKFIIDQTQTPNLKVKVALLNYIHGLTLLMDPTDFVNTSDTRLAVSRIITWTTEPKSVDVRKAAQAVLIALFNLNTPEFSMMLTHLPKTFQDGATKILHNHVRSSSAQESEPLSPRNVTSPTLNPMPRYRASPNRAAVDEMETENMNPEEIYNSIKKTSADIQNLSKLDGHYDDPKKERDCTSQDSGIQSSLPDVRGLESPAADTKAAGGSGGVGGVMGGMDSTDSPQTNHLRQQQQQYNPSYYQDDNLNGYNRAALAEAVFDVENELFNEAPWKNLLGLPNKPELPLDESDVIAEILTELSNHNEREKERKNAMLQLIKMTREGTLGVWEEHFKSILLMLLETLGDNDPHIRAMSLRVLREILKYQPERFRDYTELTILKVLEAHKDPIKEVTRVAEECASTLASSISPELCVRVLIPVIQTAEFPINLAAIKMQSKAMEIIPRETLDRMLQDIIPGLLSSYDNTESSVRKASVFCLVAIYLVIGEDLRPYLNELTGSKMKLLNLYIKRALSQKGEASSTSTSHTASPQNLYDQV